MTREDSITIEDDDPTQAVETRVMFGTLQLMIWVTAIAAVLAWREFTSHWIDDESIGLIYPEFFRIVNAFFTGTAIAALVWFWRSTRLKQASQFAKHPGFWGIVFLGVATLAAESAILYHFLDGTLTSRPVSDSPDYWLYARHYWIQTTAVQLSAIILVFASLFGLFRSKDRTWYFALLLLAIFLILDTIPNWLTKDPDKYYAYLRIQPMLRLYIGIGLAVYFVFDLVRNGKRNFIHWIGIALLIYVLIKPWLLHSSFTTRVPVVG